MTTFNSIRKRNFFLILFLLALNPVSVLSQDNGAEITVRVTDPQNENLQNAEVTLHARDGRLRLSCVTDSNGTCVFKQLITGEYLIEAEADGFARAATRALSVERTSNPTVEISLAVAGVNEQVVVTAQNTAQPVDEVSKAVSVVDAREIEDRDESTVTDALRTVPGLRIQQLGGPGKLVSIKSRGLRNQDTAVLIDGLRFRDATTGEATSFLSDFLVTNVDRRMFNRISTGPIEIKAGPHAVDKLVATYSEAETGAVCALFGSTEHLEIAVNGSSAAERLQLARGAPVTISKS